MGLVVSAVAALVTSLPPLIAIIKSIFEKPPVAPPPAVSQVLIEKKMTEAEYREKVRKDLGVDFIKNYNWAIIGMCGAGKSSLINSILGVNPRSKGAAKVDIVQCTMERKEYIHPEFPHLRIWDLPGCGTTEFPLYASEPDDHYIHKFQLMAFDVVLILYDGKMFEEIPLLFKELKKYNLPCYIIRTKVDIDFNSAIDDNGFSAEEAKEYVRTSFSDEAARNLKADFDPSRFFLISVRDFVKGRPIFDEIALLRCISMSGRR